MKTARLRIFEPAEAERRREEWHANYRAQSSKPPRLERIVLNPSYLD